MGLTHIEAIIANPANPKKARRLTLLLDSGAVYSVVPKTVFRTAWGKAPFHKDIHSGGWIRNQAQIRGCGV
jgi:hypothetical protein